MADPALLERITRSLAFMLRHQPEKFDLELDPFGFADIDEVVRALNERLGEPVVRGDVVEAVQAGDRQRYEIQESKIRALYGHSIPVEPGPAARPPEMLYVAVAAQDVERAGRFGLRGGRRRFLHLALTPEDAMEAGKRLDRDYTVLAVHALDAWEEGVNFFDRKSLWLAEEVPTHLLEVGETFHDGSPARFPEREGGRPQRFDGERRHDHGRRDQRGRGGRGERGGRGGSEHHERHGHGQRAALPLPHENAGEPVQRETREESEGIVYGSLSSDRPPESRSFEDRDPRDRGTPQSGGDDRRDRRGERGDGRDVQSGRTTHGEDRRGPAREPSIEATHPESTPPARHKTREAAPPVGDFGAGLFAREEPPPRASEPPPRSAPPPAPPALPVEKDEGTAFGAGLS